MLHLLRDHEVSADDGNTYERVCIEQWFSRAATSPQTNEPLPHTSLTPNRAMKTMIQEFLERARALQIAIDDAS